MEAGMNVNNLSQASALFKSMGGIKFACALSPHDRVTMEMARYYSMRERPRAQRHLDQYLLGKGDLEVNTNVLLIEDAGIRNVLYRVVRIRLTNGEKKGVIPIQQSTYMNQDWRYALGAISMNWELDEDESHVVFWFADKYDWHPEEARVTQCVHRAAESLKKEGAKEYSMIGTKAKIPIRVVMGSKPFGDKTRIGIDTTPK